MAMIDNSNSLDFSGRPRRVVQSPGKIYDRECDRNLELRGILEVLSAYNDYEGGINCSKCGKLYKSKVCFTKHLWEHSVYWDLFPGDKNHERVLAIQAALILYSSYLGVAQEDAERLRDLLVTSPSGHDALSTHTTPKKMRTTPNFSSPRKQVSENTRPAPYATSLETARPAPYPSTPKNTRPALCASSPVPSRLFSPVTPVKEFERRVVCPDTPRKDKRKFVAARMQRSVKRKRRLLLD